MRPPRSFDKRRHAIAVAAIALLGAIASGCGDDSRQPIAQAASRATHEPAPTRTPTGRVLPVTPVSSTYVIADPAFDALPGATAHWGTYAGGAYQIEVPDDWNGNVVYYAHGYRMNAPDLVITPPPIREHLVGSGYAWAASSYTRNGYEPGVAANDTFALHDVFLREVGPPARSYLYGQSMGGHVVSVLLEQNGRAYDGAMAECGAVSGNTVLDYFMSWGVLAGHFSGVDLGDLTLDPEAFGSAVNTHVLPALGTADALTPGGQAFASVIEQLTGGPRPYFDEGFGISYGINFGILGDAIARAGAANAVAQNAKTEYRIPAGFGVTSAELNRDVERVRANPAFRDDRERYPEFADFTGEITTPYLTLHNTGDLFVPISVEQEYRRRVDAAGNGELLVQRAIRRPGHCAFSQEELTRAFDDLTAWVETGSAPAGDDLLGDLHAAGIAFTEPLEPDDPAAQGAAAR